MAINISIIESKTSLAASRLIINSNFAALKGSIDNLYLYLDPTTSILSGLKSLTVNDTTTSINSNVLNIGNSAQIFGNLQVGTDNIDNHIILKGNTNSSITVQNGDIQISNGNISIAKNSNIYGNLNIGNTGGTGGSINLISLNNSFNFPIDISNEPSPYIIQSVDGFQGIIIQNIDNVNDVEIKLPLASSNGQSLYISYIKGPSAGNIKISGSLLDPLNPQNIELSESGDVIQLLGLSTYWALLNYSAVSFLNGSNVSSIKII